jgi:hypothetical protein
MLLCPCQILEFSMKMNNTWCISSAICIGARTKRFRPRRGKSSEKRVYHRSAVNKKVTMGPCKSFVCNCWQLLGATEHCLEICYPSQNPSLQDTTILVSMIRGNCSGIGMSSTFLVKRECLRHHLQLSKHIVAGKNRLSYSITNIF